MFKLALSFLSHHRLYLKKNACTGDGGATNDVALDTENSPTVEHGEI